MNIQTLRAAVICTKCFALGVALPLIGVMPFNTLSAAAQAITINASNPRSLEGIWSPEEGPAPGSAQQGESPSRGQPEGPGDSSLQVELTGTVLQCAPVQHLSVGGGGMSMLLIQGSAEIVLISEFDMDIGRKIYLNAKHPKHIVPQPNGHSIGHWQGNTLVIDTIGYADKTGKDSGQHIVEYLSKDGDTLTDEMSIVDQSGQAHRQTLRYQSRAAVQFNENVCEEGFERYQVINGVLDNPNVSPDRNKPR